ncbi:ribonuclease M5 [Vagococcus coleopterorum]|uniref:Ribonuclease M5 n=1 Tax=Vagococcus coleopterorum TaxID=2714946 RepID=A0A6G8ALD4_9ENTE|nr:ribonuclease M5 [Vagococcus coleopterorum]QIL45881.1 ribonuclease M5 [Vagococcus coleopterorum]
MVKKQKINEMVVVEGKDDTKRLQQFLEVDTIETIGSAIDEAILERIRLAQEVRGVIVLTDPDFSGEKIRKIITAEVPGVKHAFITREEGEPSSSSRGKSLGVEHASKGAIEKALKHVMTPTLDDNISEMIPREVLIGLGLIAGPKAKRRREQLGNKLRIGYTNAKQLEKRLLAFRITEEELAAAMIEVLEEEKRGV